MKSLHRFMVVAGASALALASTACTMVLGDVDFQGTGGSTGSTTSATSSTSSTGGGSTTTSTTSSTSTGTMACAGVTCDPHATCDDSSGSAVCTCNSGYLTDPQNAGKCIDDPCQPDPCNGNGTCTLDVTSDSFACACKAGFIGAACDSCVWFVDAAASGTGDGSSWTNAFNKVQDALAAGKTAVTSGAGTCDVWVKAGTYYAYQTSHKDSFSLTANVGVYGGFDGTETARDQAKPTANKTILDGRKSATNSSAVEHVVQFFDQASGTIDGFTIQGGNADGGGGAEEDRHGGGLLIYAFHASGSFTVSNCEITGNSATYGGGLAMIWGSPSITVTGCNIHGNAAGAGGGGMSCVGNTCTVTGTTFQANTAGSNGGGMDAAAVLLATGVTFADNISGGDGGGLRIATVPGSSLTDVIFSGNHAGGIGGGMRSSNSAALSVTSALFVGNSAGQTGGAIGDSVTGGTTYTDCTITGNHGISGGDGIIWDGGAPHLYNTILWGNPSIASASTGDDLKPATWTSIVTSHCDIHGFAGSDATSFDASPLFAMMPAFFDYVAAGTSNLNSVVVTSGTPYAVNDVIEIGGDGVGRTVVSILGSTVKFTPSLAVAPSAGTAIRDWGSTLQTLDAHLSDDSTCIDAGDPATAPSTDLSGAARVGNPDIGAYEHP